MRVRITWFLLSLSVAGASWAQSNIPIDSPRGNYAGAENIHWYQQSSLRAEDYENLLPVSGSPFLCNEDDLTVDCFGSVQREPQEAWYGQGVAPVLVSLFVDSRSTDGFDFPFRRAIDAIRRANDAFSRSGINARLYVSNIRSYDFDAQGLTFVASEVVGALYDDPEYIDRVTFEDQADVLVFVRNVDGRESEDGSQCGAAASGPVPAARFLVPVVVLSCEDSASLRFFNNRMASAHELGHVFGLDHPPQQGSTVSPHLSFGYGYISPELGLSTIMDGSGGVNTPFFSSPNMLVGATFLGDAETSDSVRAANQAATTVSLYWEIAFGSLRSLVSSASTEQSLRTPPPVVTEGPWAPQLNEAPLPLKDLFKK